MLLTALPTGLVAALEADADPPELEAVRETRTVSPRSATATVYDALIAPAMGEQFAPLALQLSHW